jgi:phosphoglycolate phosphatase-like HAD superfamily hydrolase
MLGGVHCWVFDLDGTLTIPNHDFDAIRAQLGIPEGHLILEYLDGLPAASAAPLYRRLDRIEAELAATVAGQPGCRALVEALHGAGDRIGILTRNSRANAHTSLARIGLDDLFDDHAILGREDAMVGDDRLDLEAGRNAGVRTVHFDISATFAWPELMDLGIRTLPELLRHR